MLRVDVNAARRGTFVFADTLDLRLDLVNWVNNNACEIRPQEPFMVMRRLKSMALETSPMTA